MATILVAPRKRRKREFRILQKHLLKKIQRRLHEASHEDIRTLINATATEETGIRFVMISDADDLLQYLERMEGDSMEWHVDGDYVFVETWYDIG